MTELFRWYIARMRRDAESRSAQQKLLTPMTLVARDNVRIQEMIERSGKVRIDRSAQVLRELQSRGKSAIASMLNASKLVEDQQIAMAKLISALDPQTKIDTKEITLEQVAELVVKELERARQGERLIADSTPDLLCSLDKDLKFQEMNVEFELTTKYQKLSIVTSSILNVIPSSERGLFQAYIERCRTEDGTAPQEPLECPLNAAHGELVDLEWHIEYSPTAKSFFCQARNIGERKQRERLQAEVNAMINHDLRTPVSGVRLVLENAASGFYGAISETGTTRLNQALSTIEQMLSLIDQLLDAGKLQAGEMTANPSDTKLSEVYARCESMVKPLLEDKTVSFPQDSKLSAHADPDQITRVLSNLTANAVKFAPAGSTITIKEESKLGRSVIISVHDDGPGIPEELQPFVFERYKAGRGGTGLGLYIARKFTELQGGEIGFKSTPGEGTTFWFTLPQVQ